MPSESCPEDCTNGIDDDADGLADCLDADCYPNEDCPENCGNMADDDDDGFVDCEDPDCQPDQACPEICDNGVDDDDDGYVDCIDYDCRSLSVCDEICNDGIDNNGNGSVDCDDYRCEDAWECGETQEGSCSDGVDNDGDSLIDCEDGGCFRFCVESVCGNGLDDDADGLVDCDDVDCWSISACPDAVGLFWTGSEMEVDSDFGIGGWSGTYSADFSFYWVKWEASMPAGTAWFNLDGNVGSCHWFATHLYATYSHDRYNSVVNQLQSLKLPGFESSGACSGQISQGMFEFHVDTASPVRLDGQLRGLDIDGQPFGARVWNDRRPWIQQVE